MRDVRPLSAEEFATALFAVECPVILTHTHPDGDTVGTAAALIEAFRAIGKDAAYASEEPLPARLAFLTEGMRRATDFTGLTPIAVDTASPIQLGTLSESLENGASVALMLDHHEVGTPFAPYYLIPGASSAGEVLLTVIDAAEKLGILTLNKKIATPLFAAISSDTGCFRFSNTTPSTHLAAARLLALGVDAADINHRLFDSKELTQLAAEGLTAERLHTPLPHVAGACIPAKLRRDRGIPLSDFETAIDIVRSLAGTEIAYVIKEIEEGTFRISLRSTRADVSAVAAALGGGGHVRAAGCTVKAPDIKSAEDTLLAAIRKEVFSSSEKRPLNTKETTL